MPNMKALGKRASVSLAAVGGLGILSKHAARIHSLMAQRNAAAGSAEQTGGGAFDDEDDGDDHHRGAGRRGGDGRARTKRLMKAHRLGKTKSTNSLRHLVDDFTLDSDDYTSHVHDFGHKLKRLLDSDELKKDAMQVGGALLKQLTPNRKNPSKSAKILAAGSLLSLGMRHGDMLKANAKKHLTKVKPRFEEFKSYLSGASHNLKKKLSGGEIRHEGEQVDNAAPAQSGEGLGRWISKAAFRISGLPFSYEELERYDPLYTAVQNGKELSQEDQVFYDEITKRFGRMTGEKSEGAKQQGGAVSQVETSDTCDSCFRDYMGLKPGDKVKLHITGDGAEQDGGAKQQGGAVGKKGRPAEFVRKRREEMCMNVRDDTPEWVRHMCGKDGNRNVEASKGGRISKKKKGTSGAAQERKRRAITGMRDSDNRDSQLWVENTGVHGVRDSDYE